MTRPLVVVLWLLLIPAAPINSQSRSAPALYELGSSKYQSALRQADYDTMNGAVEDLTRAVELNPSYADAHLTLARAFIWLGDYERAATAASTARRTGGDPREVALVQAELAALQGDVTRAHELYASVLSFEPYNSQARLGIALLQASTGATQALINELDTLRRTYPQQRRLILALALLYLERQNYTQAERYSELALRYYPNFAQVHTIAAEIALAGGDYEEAISRSRNALNINPSLASAWDLIARAAMEINDEQLALGAVQELISLDSTDEKTWYRYAVLSAEVEDVRRAVQGFERALLLRKDFELAQIALENTVIQHDQIGTERRRNLAVPYLQIARDYEQRFLYDRAERALRRGLQISPLNPTLRYALAQRYLDDGYPARYLSALKIVIENVDTTNTELDVTKIRDEIESYTSLLSDSLDATTQIDQFVADRPRATIGVTVVPQTTITSGTDSSNPRTPLLFSAEQSARFLVGLLDGEEHLDLADTISTAYSPSAALLEAGRKDYQYVVLWTSSHYADTRTVSHVDLRLTRTGESLVSRRLVRSGNDAIAESTQVAANAIASAVPRFGSVLSREFETVVFSGGRIDNIDPERDLSVFKAGELPERLSTGPLMIPENRIIGTLTVQESDDLISQGVFKPKNHSDRLVVGDYVFLGPYPEPDGETSDDERPTESENTPVETNGNEIQNFFQIDLVNKLFSIR